MTNRKIVLGLIVANAGFVFGVLTLGTSGNLLGSALNFFTDPSSVQRLAEFDDDGDSIPDPFNGTRILEIFRSAPEIFSPLFGHPTFVPGMIRLDDAFYMPEPGMPAGRHGAAPIVTEAESETEVNFSAIEPRWSPEEIRVSNEFEGGTAAPGMYLIPPTAISPSSSLPAFLTMPSAPPSSTPPAVTAPPSSTPPVTSTPPAVVPPVTSSSVSSSSLPSMSATSTSSSIGTVSGIEHCSNGLDDDGDFLIDSGDPDCMTEFSESSAAGGEIAIPAEASFSSGF